MYKRQLFIVAFGFVLWMLLHFSVAVSRLTDQSKILAQRLALLEERQRRAEEGTGEEERLELAEVKPARPEHAFRGAGKR